MIYLGIDPGKNGGIAIVEHSGKASSMSMPETVLDLVEALASLERGSDGECFAVLEDVHSSPQMGVVSAFTFGRGFGHLEMALAALKIPHEKVRPQVWQKSLGCLSGGDKNKTKARAQSLFPQLKITHANADALLIAEYCRRTYNKN